MPSLGPTCKCPRLPSPAFALECRIGLNAVPSQVLLNWDKLRFNAEAFLIDKPARDFITTTTDDAFENPALTVVLWCHAVNLKLQRYILTIKLSMHHVRSRPGGWTT